mgnify:CR=1 FL=1
MMAIESGREDLNLRLLAPHASALAGLRYAPRSNCGQIIAYLTFSDNPIWKKLDFSLVF